MILYLLPGTTEEIRFPMSKGLVGDAVTTKSIVNVSDAYTDSRFIKAIDVTTGYRTQSVMCVSVLVLGIDGSLIIIFFLIVLLATGTRVHATRYMMNVYMCMYHQEYQVLLHYQVHTSTRYMVPFRYR